MSFNDVVGNPHAKIVMGGTKPGIISRKYEQNGIQYYVNPTVMITSTPDTDMTLYAMHLEDTYGEAAAEYTTKLRAANGWLAPELMQIMTAGQGCYASYVSKFTDFNEAERYVDTLMQDRHFSVTEHINISWFLAGISRNLLAELTRHRHTDGPSVQSQRYCDRSVYRFVLRPEYEGHPELTERFTLNCAHALDEYDWFAEKLAEVYPPYQEMSKRDKRFASNQSSRGALPGWTETNGTWTWNIRSFIHILVLRGSVRAEPEIRRLAWFLLMCAKEAMPEVFRPFTPVSTNPVDGWKQGLNIPYFG